MVEDMDEAAVYGSPLYHLLEEVFSAGRPANESDSSDNGRGDAIPATDEANAGAQPQMAAEGVAESVTNMMVDFDRAWRLFGKGEMDAGRVLAVLTRIHGKRMDAWWPFVRAALPASEVSSPIAQVHA